MKKVFLILALFAFALPLYGALSDPSALKLAKATWGDVAMIGQKRDMFQSNWTKLVGYKSPMCVEEFTQVGTGFSTWDTAFADATAHPAEVGGPFKGTITVQVNAYDSVALATVQFYIDGNAIAMANVIPPSPALQFISSMWNVDTTMLTNGFHVLCAQATDTAGLLGKTYTGHLFQVDQTAGQTGTLWFPGIQTASRPSIAFAKPPLVQK